MKQRYNELTEDLCCLAVKNWLKGKWRRRECLRLIEEYAGIPQREIIKELDSGGHVLKDEAVKNLGYEVYNRLIRLTQGKANALDLDPVTFEPRRDGMSGKLRDIAQLCAFHQIYNHLLALGVMPLLKAKLLPSQFASIPRRGQNGLKKYFVKKLRKKSLDIRHARKTDVIKAYPNAKYSVIIDYLKAEIPSAKWIIILLTELAKMSPTGSLIIGGYIDAWLFNYLMSYALRYAKEQHKIRRGKKTPLIKVVGSFMDDFGFMGSRDADIKRDIKLVDEFLSRKMNLKLKYGKHTEFLTIAGEKERRKETSPARRACPFLDLGGYRMTFTHVTVRKPIFRRVRRSFLRAGVELKATGKLSIQRARSVVCFFGYFKNTDSIKARRKYDADHLHAVARYTVSQYQKYKNRRNILNEKDRTNVTA